MTTNSAVSAASPSTGRDRWGFGFFLGHLVTVWGIALSNVLLGLAILRTAARIRSLRWDWSRNYPLLLPLGLYTIFFVVSALTSLDPAISVPELKEIFSLATLPLALVLVRGERRVRQVFDGLIWMVGLLALHGIVQHYAGDYGTLDRRIEGLFSHYQTFSGILLLGDMLLVARLVTGNGYRRPLSWLILVLINWALLLTLTRGAWVALGAVLTLLVIARMRRFFIGYLLLAVFGAGVFFLAAPESWSQRMRSIVDLQDPSNYDRLCMADASFYMIAERPLFGIGPEMVEERYPIYRHPSAPRLTVPHLHNTFLQIAAEQGLLSLAAYLALTIAALRLAYRAFHDEGESRGPRADLYLGVLLGMLGFNLAGLFEDNWRDTEVQRLALFLLAVPSCLAASDPSRETERPEDIGKTER